MAQGVDKQVGILPTVKSKGHFFAVGLEMLRADFVPRSHDASLQERERGFNRIGIDISLCVDVELVPNCFMSPVFSEMLRRSLVGLKVIGEQDIYILADVLSDVLFKGSALHIFRMEKSEIAAALTDSNYDFFVVMQRGFSFEPILSADERFIHFNFSAQHGLVDFDHCGADAMAEIPRGFVADSERALNLAGRHALLGFTEKQGSEKPLGKRKMRVVEDRSGCHAELIVATFAVVEGLFGLKLDSSHLAARALDAFGPAQAGQHLPALLIGREHGMYVN